MSSIIESVYAALDSMTVSYLDKDNATATPTTYTLSESLDSVQTAHLPCRLLIFPTVSQILGPGPESTATYTVNDLFLLEAIAQGGGTKVQAPVLLRYVKAYQDAIALKWQFISVWQTEALTTNITYTPGRFEYPSQSGNWYYGVNISIIVEEIF